MKNKLTLSVQFERLGTVVSPDENNEHEGNGMINPASLVNRKGEILIYPRAVQKPNISRMARLQLDLVRNHNASVLDGLREVAGMHAQKPVGRDATLRESSDNVRLQINRLGNGLVPRAPFEFRQSSGEFGVGHGIEDARITYMPDLDLWICCYTAFGPSGPRCAMAFSKDGWNWRRLGLTKFSPALGLGGDDKDGVMFPRLVRSPQGKLSFAYYHRPMHPLDLEGGPEKYARVLALPAEERDCTRIGYIPAERVLEQVKRGNAPTALLDVEESVIVLPPGDNWGRLKNGAGTPPVLTKWGYVSFFHGVDAQPKNDGSRKYKMLYRAGVIVHDQLEPHKIRYVSPEPVLSPVSAEEKIGVVDNIVFPTAITQFDRSGQPAFDLPLQEQGDSLTALLLWGAGDYVTNGGLVTIRFAQK